MIKTEISKFVHLLKEENDHKAHLVIKLGGELTPEQVVSISEDVAAVVSYFETKYKNQEVGEVLPPFEDYMQDPGYDEQKEEEIRCFIKEDDDIPF